MGASNVDVFYQINGGNQIIETLDGVIMAGQSVEYTFTTAADFSVIGDYEITSGTILSNDEDSSNDTISRGFIILIYSTNIGSYMSHISSELI